MHILATRPSYIFLHFCDFLIAVMSYAAREEAWAVPPDGELKCAREMLMQLANPATKTPKEVEPMSVGLFDTDEAKQQKGKR